MSITKTKVKKKIEHEVAESQTLAENKRLRQLINNLETMNNNLAVKMQGTKEQLNKLYSKAKEIDEENQRLKAVVEQKEAIIEQKNQLLAKQEEWVAKNQQSITTVEKLYDILERIKNGKELTKIEKGIIFANPDYIYHLENVMAYLGSYQFNIKEGNMTETEIYEKIRTLKLSYYPDQKIGRN